MRRAIFLTAALSVATASTAAARNLKVEVHEGRVTVDATAVPVRNILTEWGKVTVSWWSHKIRGLHRNDLILAARTDEVYEA